MEPPSFKVIHYQSILPDSCIARGHAQDSHNYAFVLFEFLRMPFGLTNAALTLQGFINQNLHVLHFCYAYIDDALIASCNQEEHTQHLQMMLERLEKHGVIINPPKCELASYNFLEIKWTKMEYSQCQPLEKRDNNLNFSIARHS